MRKKVFGKQLGRNRKSREALFVNLVKNIIDKGSMVTTLTKAKAIQPELDRLMKDVSDGSVAARRHASSYLRNDRATVEKLFSYTELAKSRTSGFSRITRLPARRGDAAEMAKLEFLTSVKSEEKAVEAKSEPSQVSSEA